MKKTCLTYAGVLILLCGCAAPVTSGASLRLAHGGTTEVDLVSTGGPLGARALRQRGMGRPSSSPLSSVFPGVYALQVTSPQSGAIDWTQVEAVEPYPHPARTAGYIIGGLSLTSLIVALTAVSMDLSCTGFLCGEELIAPFAFLIGLPLGIVSANLLIGASRATRRTREFIEAERDSQIALAAERNLSGTVNAHPPASTATGGAPSPDALPPAPMEALPAAPPATGPAPTE